ncbi:MAG: alpha/beta fold hydrolase [bacterium]
MTPFSLARPGNAVELSAVRRADTALRDAYAARGGALKCIDWSGYDALVEALQDALQFNHGGRLSFRSFDYEHPVRLQHPELGVGKPYSVRLAYSDPGGDGEPVIAIGGITNVVQRFDFLTLDSAPALRVIGLELAGRGRSGWLAELSDYHLDAYIEQLEQFIDYLGRESCTLLGSSLGGSIAICFAARHPQRVRRIILNDSGPYIPVARRVRRAKAVARHYVFRSPAEMFRRTGAATKHSGSARPTRIARLPRRSRQKPRLVERVGRSEMSGAVDSRHVERCHVGRDHRQDARPRWAVGDPCARGRAYADLERRRVD